MFYYGFTSLLLIKTDWSYKMKLQTWWSYIKAHKHAMITKHHYQSFRRSLCHQQQHHWPRTSQPQYLHHTHQYHNTSAYMWIYLHDIFFVYMRNAYELLSKAPRSITFVKDMQNLINESQMYVLWLIVNTSDQIV